MFALMLCAAFLVIVGRPKSALGKVLASWLVDCPARALSSLRPTSVGLVLVGFAISALVVLLFESEGAILLGMALPEVAVWFTAFDAVAFMDLFATLALGAASARFRGLGDRVKTLTMGIRQGAVALLRRAGHGRQGGGRARRPCGRPAKGDDGEDGAGAIGALAWA